MKKTLYSILTLLTFVTFAFVPNSFAQVSSPEYVVRVIYFLPNDRAPQPDINEKLDKLIKDTQLFYADQMMAHGFGSKTFRFEADTAGKLVVHRLNGQFNDAYYNNGTSDKVWQEIKGRFDLSNNIYLTAIDTSTELISNFACGLGGGSSLGGHALIPASGSCFGAGLIAHELGHAFGLQHDYRTNGRWALSAYTTYISYGEPDRMITSFCSAEWLDVHRYFEINQTLFKDQRRGVETLDPSLTSSALSPPSEMTHLCGVGAFDSHEYFNVSQTVPGDALPTFEMLGPPTLAAAPNTIRFRFSVTDADGIHQVQLLTPEWGSSPDFAGGFIACKRVSGTSATVEFVTTELSSRNESVWLQMMDVHGNFHASQLYPINITTVLPPDTAVSIPDPQLAAAIREEIGDITTHSLLDLRRMNASNYTGITDLTGLEQAYNLRDLRGVYEGEIRDLRPLANLTGLFYLTLYDHQIRDIRALGNLTNLQFLYLSSNQISDITALGNLTNLRLLLLGSNQISDITALGNLTNLTSLSLDANQIGDITALGSLTTLTSLSLDANQIGDITALGNLTNLIELSLVSNQIGDITALGNSTNLKSLFLSFNQMSDITTLENLTTLTYLSFDANQIGDITALGNLTNLIQLSVRANQISDISSLARLTQLEWLDLRTNQITDVRPLVDLINLNKLYLAGNPIEDLSPLRTLLANNPNLVIDIDVPPPSPTALTFSPNTIADQTFTSGEVVNLTLPIATGGTSPYTYTLSPIPAGLSFDETRRVLSGTPTTAETTPTTYTATDAANVSASLTFTIEVTAGVILDVNGDGQVNVLDLVLVAVFYGTRGDGLAADVNADGIVNVQDFAAVAAGVDAAGGLAQQVVEDILQAAIEQAAALEPIAAAPIGAGNPPQQVFASGIVHRNFAAAFEAVKHHTTNDVRLGKWMPLLEELLERLREITEIPETTTLLPNYPNPFNPETWIPYHLSTEAAVIVSIHDVRGVSVRALMLGYQPAGVYQSKHRAAYWDGRNESGESVASGLYFYTLTAGDFTATRKLLIVK